MKFAEILKAAGGSPKSFPRASEIPITLYDEDDSPDTSETVLFKEPVFAENRREQSRFFAYVSTLEEHPVESMNVRIDTANVIVCYKSPKVRFFARA